MQTLLLLALAACAPRLPAASTPVTPVAEDCGVWTRARLQKHLDRVTESLERPSNRAELLIDGVHAFQRRWDNSADAELILVKTFIFAEDDTGHAVAKLLSERARAGAEVWFQYDMKASIRGGEDVRNMLALANEDLRLGELPLVRQMREAGVHIVAANAPRRPSRLARWGNFVEGWSAENGVASPFGTVPRFDHEKYWITGNRQPDGDLELRVIMGGMNLASEYAYGGSPNKDGVTGRAGWRDTDIELRGPVTNDVVERYLDVTELHLGERLSLDTRARINPPQRPKGEAAVRFVWNHPILGNKRHIEQLYQTLIEATPPGAPLRIATAYFAPRRRVLRPLHQAMRDGDPISVITNSPESIDVWFVSTASRHAYRSLVRINPEAGLYEWRPQEDQGWFTFHAKQAAFGVCGPVIVGSANLDAQSSEHNTESVVAIRDPRLRAEFDAMFDQDLAAGRVKRLDAEDLERPGFIERVRQGMVYTFFWYMLDDRGGATPQILR